MEKQDQESTGSRAAYFVFDSPPAPETFVFKLTDPEKIRHARDILSGREKHQVHVTGIILKSPAPYNPDWSFHYDPESIEFFEFAIEVCDSAIRYVEEHLDEVGGAFLPDDRWCPWGSRLLREIAWPDSLA
ncbi:MAG TPA: calmodulin [Blastocatellia bacterium]|nr:calmodulin [Blastocatellia bacterium]